jgi:hypothetical protein
MVDMIEINDVDKLESDALELRLIHERRRQEAEKLSRENYRREKMELALQAQKLAEEALSKELLKIEDSIKDTIKRSTDRYVYYTYYSGNNLDNQIRGFLYSILIPMILLKGFICDFDVDNNRRLKISW